MLAPEVETGPWASSSCSTISRTANNSPISSSARRSTGRNSVMPGSPRPEKRAASLTSPSSRSPTSASSRTPSRGESDRDAPLRDARRDRSDLLDERHDRDAELHPADCGRPRELGDGIHQATPQRASRRGSASSRRTTPARSSRAPHWRPSTSSASATSPSARETRIAAACDRALAGRRLRAHSVLRGSPRRGGGRARRRSPKLERRTRSRRGRAEAAR